MKKDRNSFFSEYSMNSFQSPNMMPMPGQMPNQMFSANSNFYAGPAMQNNPNMYSDIDARFAKIERTINRLEARINRLEGDNQTNNINIDEYNNNNPMYMV